MVFALSDSEVWRAAVAPAGAFVMCEVLGLGLSNPGVASNHE